MQSPDQAPGDVVQVIPRRIGTAVGGGGATLATATGERVESTASRFILLLPERRRKLSRYVIATLGACGVIIVAAGIAHLVRPNETDSAYAATTTPPAVPATTTPATITPTAPAAPAADLAPTSGSVRLTRPAVPGKVWIDGQKIVTATTTLACGKHSLKVGHAKAHSIDVPCGGELAITH